MTEHPSKAAPESLDSLAIKIADHATKADDQLIEAALLVREAHRRVKEGEAGPVTWDKWAKKNIKLSKSRLHELETIAEAEDPRAALEEIRERTRERVQKHRDRKAEAAPARETARKPAREPGTAREAGTAPVSGAAHEGEPERRQLIEWAGTAPIQDVRWVLGLIEDLAAVLDEGPADGGPVAGKRHAA